MRINMKYDTFFSGTRVVAHGLECDIIKVWKEWLPFIVIGNICFSHTNYKSGLGTRSFFVPVGKLSTDGCATQRDIV